MRGGGACVGTKFRPILIVIWTLFHFWPSPLTPPLAPPPRPLAPSPSKPSLPSPAPPSPLTSTFHSQARGNVGRPPLPFAYQHRSPPALLCVSSPLPRLAATSAVSSTTRAPRTCPATWCGLARSFRGWRSSPRGRYRRGRNSPCRTRGRYWRGRGSTRGRYRRGAGEGSAALVQVRPRVIERDACAAHRCARAGCRFSHWRTRTLWDKSAPAVEHKKTGIRRVGS